MMEIPQTAGQPVLLIARDPEDQALLKAHLADLGCRVTTASGEAEALELVRQTGPQLVLLAAQLGEDAGLDVCRRLRQDAAAQDVPLILLLGEASETDKLEALRAGVLDFLSLPPDKVELAARVTAALRLKQLEDKARNVAIEDGLTGLLSRTSFTEHFQRECNRSRRYDSLFALVVFDIDGFKQINDRYGLAFGDHVLKEVAAILRQQTRESDFLGRWGGNEFIVMLPEADLPKAIGFARKLYGALTEQPFTSQGQCVRIEVSVGVASRQNIGGRDPGEILKLVQGCLNAARKAGANRIAYHSVGEFNLVWM